MAVQDIVRRPDDRKTPPPAQRQSAFASAMNFLKRHKMLVAVVIAAILIGVGYDYYTAENSTAGKPIVATAQRGDIEDLVTAVGNLQPVYTVDVGAQVTGQLKKLYVKIGDEVQKGQLVAEIDSTVASAKVDADNAQLQNLQAQLLEKQSGLALATSQFDRQTRLLKDMATSQDAYDSAQAAQKSAAAQVKAVQAQITQSQSTLKADQATLGYAKIDAPMSGTVSAIPTKEGQTLNANQQAPTILTIADLSTMTVYTQVSEADVSKLHAGMPAYFTTLGDPARRWNGTLRQILPTPTVVNNVVLYTALFDVANPDRLLMPQMTAQVFFVLAQARNVVTVPMSALHFTGAAAGGAGRAAANGRNGGAQGTGQARGQGRGQGGQGRGGQGRGQRVAAGAPQAATVTVVSDSGAQETRNVMVGVNNRVDAEIISGLQPGEKVVAGLETAVARTANKGQNKGGGVGGPKGIPGAGAFFGGR